jgi:prepilin-type N-terminal cleavage/methylation domain-containing protein
MVSANLKKQAGFTLLEVMVALIILSVIASIGLFFSMDSYRNYLWSTERTNVLTALMTARSRSVNNVNEKPHGLHVDANSLIIFEGSTFAASTNNQTIARSNAVSISGPDILFGQLNGDALTCQLAPCNLLVFYAGRSANVSINSEGQISW